MRRTRPGSVVVVICGAALGLALNEAFQAYEALAVPDPDGDFPQWYGYSLGLASFVAKATPGFLAGMLWRHAGFAMAASIGFLSSLATSALYLVNTGTPLTLGNSGALFSYAVTLAVISCVSGGAGELFGQRLASNSSKRTHKKPRDA